MAIKSNIDKFKQDVNSAIEALVKSLPNAVQVVATDATAIIKNRFIQEGLRVSATDEEISFPSYSEAYQKKRTQKGLANKPNRLVFTGKMLQSLTIVSTRTENTKYIVEVGSAFESEREKLLYNSERYGDVLAVSNNEKKDLQQVFSDQIDTYLKSTGLFK